MNLFNIIKLFYYVFFKRYFYLLRKKFINKNFNSKINISYNKYLLELKNNGYIVIKNFISQSECQLIIQNIENFFTQKKELTWHDENCSDQRIHGAENISKNINDFFNNKLPIEIGNHYYNGELKNLMTMANKTKFVENNKGSGQGWHRDGLNFQYKSILYLVDVNENNGPFQLIEKSHQVINIFKSCFRYNLNPFDTRIENSIAEKIIGDFDNSLKTITGKAGDLILVDTSLLHRGSPLKTGSRYALTNYYYPKTIINNYITNFKPLIKTKFY